MEAIRAAGGVGVPTIKPWKFRNLVFEKLEAWCASGCPSPLPWTLTARASPS